MEDNSDNLESLLDEVSTKYAKSFLQTVQVLADIAQTLERFYEGSHSRFVYQKSEEVAFQLGLPWHDIFEIKTAALLHDIGKTGFSDNIMSKYSAELKDNEYRIYALHPEIGKRILNNHSGFEGIAEIIYQHHEKLDGTGFPRRLMGKEIHPGAAIISVVDTYHNAMHRRQKDRMKSPSSSLSNASAAIFLDSTKNRFNSTMNFLHQKASILFDKKAVEVFTDIIIAERERLGTKTIMRLPINLLEEGMVLAEDYFTDHGLLIVARGDTITNEVIGLLFKYVDSGQLPYKILVFK